MTDFPEDDRDEEVCGEAYDHDLRVTYDGPDGRQYVCRTCDAEIIEGGP